MENPQQAEKPVVYVFHGDDALAIRRHVDSLISHMGDPALAEMNITRLDGRQSVDDELRSTANSMPFLAERRLVILTHPFTRMGTDAARKRFIALLDGLPPTTGLVLVVDDIIERRDWKSLPSTSWVRKWLNAAGPRALYKLCQLPTYKEMPGWIREEARRQGGQFTPEAAAELAAYIGNDPQIATQEIIKLLTYVDFKRPVDQTDVAEVAIQVGQADIFQMVDALAAGNGRLAQGLLHRLLEEQDALSLFGMITRQFRLLLQAREVLDEGRGSQMAAELHQAPFVADKVAGQARRFTMPQLEAAYHRLLLLDEAMKTGQAASDLALDVFVAEMTT